MPDEGRKETEFLWWITQAGERLRLVDPFTPTFYAEGRVQDLRPLIAELEGKPSVAGLQFVKRWDLVSQEKVEVLKIALADLNQYSLLPDLLFLDHPRLLFWNCGIHLAQLYLYERQLFPLAFCVLDAKRVPDLSGEQAQGLLDPDAVANRLMEEWMP